MTRRKEKQLADIMVLVFRLNGRLLEQGDRLVEGLNLTSARWQVLGALALADRPLTAPQIAEAMGITRQGAQKQLNLLMDEGLLDRRPNPSHERSPLYRLTATGKRTFAEADRRCGLWAADLGEALSEDALHTTETVLGELLARLNKPLPTHRQSERTSDD
ncbi:MarR family transcriptional regulator [Azospirillum brasilense]|uniref:Helix-turn-helix domain-containing protein n=3 Tax=Azospirillum brasilense TaxID=192 RepID=A0A0P0F266_AZOBR|nr:MULTISPECIES: helix-turn-helix domain-containing protein [Azospirillum]ALJ38856.1 hypothetical protein AMK58_25480 [Azospirillum brasilense]MDW7557108.1 helix-turn-helix domain-containing protein [Azospirillum brasilense]MDW7596784.1 helix-turn-helix domain-containing protein [Azospirillum brasilense]MDW7631851.1 helix-turn-helix domain-containing protein [Azospirillum brasilense]MDX5950757.1 helix-turn-helix domain-containing protein [Azospirillum brasilense]